MNKIVKKTISVLLVLSFLFGFAGCRKKPNNDSSSADTSASESGEEIIRDDGVDYSGEKTYIVKSGNTDYVIVTPAASDMCETYSGQVLQDYIEKSTGVTLKRYNDGDEIPSDKKIISIGKTSYLNNAGFDFDYDLNGDGFYIYTKNNNVFIEAGMKRGLLFGVYEFLERFAGVKFLSDTFEYVPESNELYIYDLTIKSVPTFSQRDMFCAVETSDEFSKMRFLDPYGYSAAKYGENFYDVWNTFGHSVITSYLQTEIYFAEHRDWYSDQGFQLNACSGFDDNDNYTGDVNSATYMLIQLVKQRIAANPGQKYFFLGQEDTGRFPCDAVNKSMKRNGDLMSAVWMIFINAIAKEIEQWVNVNYPGREVYIGTFAYKETLAPPVKEVNGQYVPINEKVVPNGNVFIMFAPLGDTCWYHSYDDDRCDRNRVYNEYLKGWAAICDNFVVWDYQCNFNNYLFWFPHYRAMKANYETYREYGFWSLTQQNSTGESSYYQQRLDVYLGSKLMWDLDRYNVSDLIKEFNYYYFGPTAHYVDEFVDIMDTNYDIHNSNGKSTHLGMYESAGIGSANAELYSLALLEKAIGLIKTAMAENENADLPSDLKKAYHKHLAEVIVQPMFMVLRNFENYYDASLKYDFAREFCEYGDLIGLRNVGEGGSYNDYKASLGI